VNSVLAGREPAAPAGGAIATSAPPVLTDEDAAEGELVIAGKPLPGSEDTALVEESAPVTEEPAPVSIQNELAAMIASVAPSTGATTEEEPGATVTATERPKGRPSNLTLARAAAPAAVVATPAVAAKPAASDASQPASGTRMVQLGAYDSEALARDAWNRLVARDGDLLGAKSLYVERATSNARVFYRLRVAGFESADQTRRMCEALRGRGVDCIPVTLQ
jgi:cell division protein FtsN